MGAPTIKPENSPCLVDVIHEWLGEQGLRKIWGLKVMNYPDFGPSNGTVKIAYIFLRDENPTEDWEGIPYFTIWPNRVEEKSVANQGRSISMYDPEFFEKLRKELDYRESSNTITCRCPQCEGVKL